MPSASGSRSNSDNDDNSDNDEELECECPCCCMSNSPSQPLNVTKSKQEYSHNSQQLNRKKSYSRSIQASWYKKHPWIIVCISRYRVFCHSCRIAKQNGLVSNFRNNIFVGDGFSNWKKALENFEEHERSDNHKEAVAKVAAFFSGTDVGTQLSAVREKSQAYHQRMLLNFFPLFGF